MPSHPIDIHDIDQGVDRKQLSQLKQRFLQLNHQRYLRACAALPTRQQQFLQLLPLLFHINHPMLPGYVSHQTPAGIYQFSPTAEQLRSAQIIARSFNYQRDLTEKASHIDALFIMGSVGTIAQSDSSDVDVWLCHSIENNADNRETLHELEQKCTRISQWAAQQIHLDVHFFLMNADDFSRQYRQSLSSEASGSAQHYLLLDEFYRTALWLAGKMPLWWFIPASQENDYANYRDKLLGRRFLKAQDLIDFGGLPGIPANEFIGAGIWQLYKAIESPYKSVLKLLLLEVYASALQQQHDTATEAGIVSPAEPLALGLKRALYNGETNADLLDPYVMAYQRIESYLFTHQQWTRLELVRRCFYFKANQALSRRRPQEGKSWQRQLLMQMTNRWGWNDAQLSRLDNRAAWKAPQVISERALLVNELNHSYRLLNDLHIQQCVDSAINNEELTILGRKLHAAFERKTGKVEWINPGISQDMSESALCILCHEKTDDHYSIPHRTTDHSWQLISASKQDLAQHALAAAPIKYTRSLLELLLWCHLNRLLHTYTKLDIVGPHIAFNSIQKQQLVHSLQQWLPLPLAITHDAFTRPAHTMRLLIIINAGVEPQGERYKKGMHILSNQQDALGYSGLRENLVITTDIALINSWGELICRHYANDALVNCLQHYLRLLVPGKSTKLPELSIRCFSSNLGNNIAQRLTELLDDLMKCFYSSNTPCSKRYILEAGNEYLLLQFFQQQPVIQRFKNYNALLERLECAQGDYSAIVIDRHGLHNTPLRLICETIKKSAIYVFYSIEGNYANLTIVDERHSLFRTTTRYHNQQTLLRPLVSFIRSALHRQSLVSHTINGSNLPKEILVYELSGSTHQQQGVVVARPLPQDLPPANFINIKAIAEIDVTQQLRYTIFCDEQEFSAWSYGDELFSAVARYIMQRRQHNERYPCYISELDLSLCQEELAQQTGLQLSHYLRLKTELEEQLNRALIAV